MSAWITLFGYGFTTRGAMSATTASATRALRSERAMNQERGEMAAAEREVCSSGHNE